MEGREIKDIFEKLLNYLHNLIFWLSAGFVSAIGGIDGDLTCLFYLTIIDCLSGILKGIKEGHVFSKNMYRGFIVRKPAIYLAVATMTQLERTTFMGEIPLRSSIIIGCTIMESVSIIENLKQLGVWLPKIVDDILAVKRKVLDKNNKEH
ncbi:phage holin family protein [Cetobacterium somerae]|uniref:phage holin family protein n=1 Tax=Cetobacterium somerae TaxID=188913 RepID=UPI00248E08AF|nr:phage holin family protein [Cetobacterium somerae]